MAVYNEEGRYRATIATAVMGQTKNGNPQLVLTLDLREYYDDQENDWIADFRKPKYPPNVYLTITDNTIGTDSNPGWVMEVLTHLQFNGDFGDLSQFDGMDVEAYCQYTENLNGDQREEWGINRPRQQNIGQLADKDVRGLNTKFGKLFKKGKSKPKPAAAAAGNGTPPSDDIPI